MNIYIANDHGGYDLKKQIMVHLQKNKHWVVNEGSDSREIVRYPYYASKVAAAVAEKRADFGILICNTGIGMSMIANKYKGVRAALVTSEETAMLTRQHNDANIICLGGKFTDGETACRLVDIFLNTAFEGGRHNISLGLIEQAEKINFSGGIYDCFDAEKHTVDELYIKRHKRQKILLDTDMLTDCDDVAALAMLLQLEKQGKAQLVGVTVSSAYPKSAAVVSAVNTYYGRGDIPVGAPKNGKGVFLDWSCFLDKVANEFPHAIESNDAAEDAVKVMRKALAQANDDEIILVTIGYMTNLESLMKSEGDEISELCGMELIRRKVREWVCMGGNFPDDPAIDNVNFTRDAAPALYCIRNFEKPITFVGRDIGHNIYVGDDFHNLPKDNPLRRAYELHRGRYGDNWDHHTADPSTLLYAVFGLGDAFEIQKGRMILHDDCSFEWDPNGKSNMAYLLQKESREVTARRINEIIMGL